MLRDFAPIWIDSDTDIENDPYTTDCTGETTISNPHAYTQFTIVNGEMTSFNCIVKQPGDKHFELIGHF